MPGKLDYRYVDFDLSTIGKLPVTNGGTGSDAITAGRAMISVATGDSTNPVIISHSNITTAELNKLAGISANASTINTRLTNLETAMGPQTHIFDATAGYQILTSGLILQWGKKQFNPNATKILYPIPFPTTVFVVRSGIQSPTDAGNAGERYPYNVDNSGFYVYASSVVHISWIAIGH